jgi:hypothetical protein
MSRIDGENYGNIALLNQQPRVENLQQWSVGFTPSSLKNLLPVNLKQGCEFSPRIGFFITFWESVDKAKTMARFEPSTTCNLLVNCKLLVPNLFKEMLILMPNLCKVLWIIVPSLMWVIWIVLANLIYVVSSRFVF